MEGRSTKGSDKGETKGLHTPIPKQSSAYSPAGKIKIAAEHLRDRKRERERETMLITVDSTELTKDRRNKLNDSGEWK